MRLRSKSWALDPLNYHDKIVRHFYKIHIHLHGSQLRMGNIETEEDKELYAFFRAIRLKLQNCWLNLVSRPRK